MFLRYDIDPENSIFNSDKVMPYKAFLSQTDYVACKIAEAQFLGKTLDEDYTEVLQARQYARDKINELLKG